MALYKGVPPKEKARRRRRNTDPVPKVTVESPTELLGPELPARPDEMEWPQRTRAWWNTWRASPQAQAMTATDWESLAETALLHAKFWSGEANLVQLAAELRRRVAAFGATYEDRLKLRMQLGDPEKPVERKDGSAVASIADYRKRLAGTSGGG